MLQQEQFTYGKKIVCIKYKYQVTVIILHKYKNDFLTYINIQLIELELHEILYIYVFFILFFFKCDSEYNRLSICFLYLYLEKAY